MSKIIFVLFATILVANLVLAVPEDEEEIAQEVQELLDYQRTSLVSQMFLNDFADLEDESEEDVKNKKCRRPLRRCCEKRKCCRNLRCSRLLKRCLPKRRGQNPPSKPPTM